jgi:hypothetical protein
MPILVLSNDSGFTHSPKEGWKERTAGHVVDLWGEASFLVPIAIGILFRFSSSKNEIVTAAKSGKIICCASS